MSESDIAALWISNERNEERTNQNEKFSPKYSSGNKSIQNQLVSQEPLIYKAQALRKTVVDDKLNAMNNS